MAVPTFLIKNGTSDFVNKQKNLFDHLAVAEKERGAIKYNDELMEIDEIKSRKRQRKETKQFRGKESLFKKPMELPLRFKKFNRIPDYQKNPHKWTKYSLADITQDDMSNKSNTAAALSFLRDGKVHKTKCDVKVKKDEPECKLQCPTLHQFTLPVKQIKRESNEPVIDNDSVFKKPMFKSSKLVMPEYVVGQGKKETKKLNSKVKTEKGKEIFLNHIHEYDDE